MTKKKIAVIFGTRPDTIKMAPIIHELKKNNEYFDVLTIATAQHRQMLDQVLKIFNIEPNYDMNIMVQRQTLAALTARIITGLDEIFEKEKPDMVLVQGDTASTAIGSLAAYYLKIPVGHVEAGLRTYDKYNPFPEEINRKLTGCIADLHFAPTETAKVALLKENVNPTTILVTGNTVIDALKYSVINDYKFAVTELNDFVAKNRKMVLITMHRRENWGEPMKAACRATKKLAIEHPEIHFIFPVHLNPAVREIVYTILGDVENISLIEPLDYLDFVNFMSKCYLIITDSGGVQEEGPHFGIPVLVLRKVTERPEAVDYGTVRLLGTDESEIYNVTKEMLTDPEAYKKMSTAVNPYGDGLSSERTILAIKNYFGFSSEKVQEFLPVVK